MNLPGTSQRTAARETIPLVIDTDPGIDDAVAVMLAMASPELNIRLLTTVHGNLDVAGCTENARRLLQLGGRSDIPVAQGAVESLVRAPPERAAHVHGIGGLGGVALDAAVVPTDPRPAVTALAELLSASRQPVTVAAIGPLTNIALLLAVYPRAAAQIGHLVIMGGSYGGGNASAAAEFNIWMDPEAAHRVLSSGVRTTLIGLDVTDQTRIDRQHVRRIAEGGRPGASELATMLEFYLSGAEQRTARPWAALHDAVVIAAILCPALISTVPRSVMVDCSTGPGRGQTIVDRRRQDTNGTVRVAESIDADAVLELVVGGLSAPGPPRT